MGTLPKIAAIKKVLSAISANRIIVKDETKPSRQTLLPSNESVSIPKFDLALSLDNNIKDF